MKQYLIGVLILFVANGLWAQVTDDSPKSQPKAKSEIEERAMSLAKMAQNKFLKGDNTYVIYLDSLQDLSDLHPEMHLPLGFLIYIKGILQVYQYGNLRMGITMFKKAETTFEEWDNQDTTVAKKIELKAMCLSSMSICYTHLGLLDSAEICLTKAIESLEPTGEKNYLSTAYNNLAMSKQSRGQFDLAMEFYNKSLKLREELKDTIKMVYVYQNIATIYNEWGERVNALKYHDRAIKLAEKIYDTMSIMYGELGIASIKIRSGQNIELLNQFKTDLTTDYLYKKNKLYLESDPTIDLESDQRDAIERLSRAYIFFEKRGSTRDVAIIQSKLGDAYAVLENWDSAKIHYEQFFELTKGSQYSDQQLFSLRKWAKIQMKNGEFDEAIQTLREAKAIAIRSGHQSLAVPLFRMLSECHEATGDFQTALVLRKQFDLTKDSIYTFQNSERRRQLTAEYEAKYETEKLRADNAIQEQRAVQMTYLTGGVGVFAMMALGFGFYYQRTGQQMSRQKQLIQTLAREHHHSSGNLLENLRHGQVKVFSAATDLEKAKQEIDHLTEAHFEVFRDMSEVYAEMNGNVALNERLAKVARSLVKIRQYEADQQVALVLDLDDIKAAPNKVHALTQITREAITNAFKHGFQNAKSAELEITLEAQGRQALLTIKDNGSGFSQQHDHSGKGLKHMEQLARDINAKLTVLNGEGTIIKVAFAV